MLINLVNGRLVGSSVNQLKGDLCASVFVSVCFILPFSLKFAEQSSNGDEDENIFFRSQLIKELD